MRRPKLPLVSLALIVGLGALIVAKKVAADDKPADKPPTGVDYATLPTPADIDPDLTEEQRAALGSGKVPIHREGPFKSPFAHPRFGGPAHVKVGMVISEIRAYSIQSGTFETEFFLSLTSDKPMPPLNLAWPNGHEVVETVLADTPTFKFFRYSGKFTSDVDLRAYPFDTQRLTIAMEDKLAGVDQVIFEADPNRTSLDSGFRISGYGVASVGAQTYKHLYPTRFDYDDLYVSRYKFSLGLDRFATSAAFSVFVPAFIIVLISLMGMWVRPVLLEIRANAGAPMLAAAVLFHYSLTQALPATGYLTRADKLMLGVYLSLLLNMASTWGFFILDEEGHERLFRRSRLWVPLATLAIMTLATVG